MEDRGYPIFRSSRKDFNLNIIGIRTVGDDANAFNDFMVVLWRYNNKWNRLDFNITTDPGVYYRLNPMNVLGTAILAEGHHKGLWQIGKHRGKYKALVQKGKARCYRDNNKDAVLDMIMGTEEAGYYGINCHRSGKWDESTIVGRWSAGCQVHSDPVSYDMLLEHCDRAKDNWGNSFSYTLLLDTWLNEEDGKGNSKDIS